MKRCGVKLTAAIPGRVGSNFKTMSVTVGECDLPSGHAGAHEATTDDGERFAYPNNLIDHSFGPVLPPEDLMDALKESFRPDSMCPHCGKTWVLKGGGLTPVHCAFGFSPIAAHCPGSLQTPRDPRSDMRDLWNGEPSPARLAGN